MLTPLQMSRNGKGADAHRSGTVFHDEFGRPYDVVIDARTKNFHPVNSPTPLFKAPFYAPQHLVKPTATLGLLKHDFEQWFHDQAEAQAEYDAALQAMAGLKFPSNTLEILADPPPLLRQLCGAQPLPNVFIRALRVGNPWITGKDPDADPSRWFSEDQLQALADYKKRQKGISFIPSMEDDTALFGEGMPLPAVTEYQEMYPEDTAQFAVPDAPKPVKRRNAKGHYVRGAA